MIKMISSAIILGSGNLALHLNKALSNSNCKVLQIFSRNRETGQQVAKTTGCDFTDNLNDVFPDADIYIFAMNDSANTKISSEIKTRDDKIFVHTAGSLSMDIFASKTKNYGVFYPFQTFSHQVELDFSKIPICLEASNLSTMNSLSKLAAELSCKQFEINEEQRKLLHLAGVFACNFMNHCVYLGEQVLASQDIPNGILQPLLEQSFTKVLTNGSFESQTGPALRNDKISMQKHLDYLKNDKNLSDIYSILSESIFKTYNNKK